ncbi:MAG: hypothetical protein IJA35_03240, partial [Clostridia bacterium]|nr:hypothetical protein [Clostridia bacterium]
MREHKIRQRNTEGKTMSKSNLIKKTLISSVIALVLCATMLLGTTFAWFTDTVESSGNIIKSGDLEVKMYWA